MVNPEDASNEEDYLISAAWMPNVDGWVFKNSALSISKTKQTHNIPFLIGFNSFEGSSLIPMFYTKNQHDNDEDWIQTIWELAIPNDPNNIDYIADENIHLVAEISNSNPYLNEGITILYKLCISRF